MKNRYKKQGYYLSQLRHQKGISQQELADMAGSTIGAVKRWENGFSFPDDCSLLQIAEKLDVPLLSLLAGETIHPGDEEKMARRIFSDKSESNRKKAITKNLLLFLIIALNIIFLLVRIADSQPSDQSLRGLAVNWGVEIPRGLTQEFAKGDRSFTGDGTSYHVFADDGRGEFYYNFAEGPDNEAEKLAEEILDTLSVPDENLPDFSHPYLWQIMQKNNEHDQLVCFFDLETQQYYFIERFK